jgi:hypothetical protein
MNKFKKNDNPEMFAIAGSQYYFDLDELSRYIRVEKTESVEDILNEAKKEMTGDPENAEEDAEILGQIVDVTKWETIKVMFECVLSDQGPIDEAMGIASLSNQLSIPFKLSFNTLLKNNIIKQQYGK